MRYLAIDYGTKRTGVAICDAEERVASPLCVLHGQRDLAMQIAQIVKAEGVGAIVVGLPINMDGSEGSQARVVRAFVEQLVNQVDIPVHVQDERLSSFGAEEKLKASGLSRGKKRDLLDAIAAAEILRAFLERKGLG
jgi:putative Holliday junction resolvase